MFTHVFIADLMFFFLLKFKHDGLIEMKLYNWINLNLYLFVQKKDITTLNNTCIYYMPTLKALVMPFLCFLSDICPQMMLAHHSDFP